jgi:hypothetical protein
LHTCVCKISPSLFPFGVSWNELLLHVFVQLVEVDVRQKRTEHASYNVAKKVLEWEFKEEIPRSRLRAGYGEGFKGAPLRCDPPSEGAFSRDATVRDAQACSPEAQAAGGRRHV